MSLLCKFIVCVILPFRSPISGSEGLFLRKLSRCVINFAASVGIELAILGIRPAGMCFLVALLSILRKAFSSFCGFPVYVTLLNLFSEYSVKLFQSALLKFIKVRLGALRNLTVVESVILIGRWSELRAVSTVQVHVGRSAFVAMLRSGEVSLFAVTLVGWSSFNIQ